MRMGTFRSGIVFGPSGIYRAAGLVATPDVGRGIAPMLLRRMGAVPQVTRRKGVLSDGESAEGTGSLRLDLTDREQDGNTTCRRHTPSLDLVRRLLTTPG